jgi:hypothetical protein
MGLSLFVLNETLTDSEIENLIRDPHPNVFCLHDTVVPATRFDPERYTLGHCLTQFSSDILERKAFTVEGQGEVSLRELQRVLMLPIQNHDDAAHPYRNLRWSGKLMTDYNATTRYIVGSNYPKNRERSQTPWWFSPLQYKIDSKRNRGVDFDGWIINERGETVCLIEVANYQSSPDKPVWVMKNAGELIKAPIFRALYTPQCLDDLAPDIPEDDQVLCVRVDAGLGTPQTKFHDFDEFFEKCVEPLLRKEAVMSIS